MRDYRHSCIVWIAKRPDSWMEIKTTYTLTQFDKLKLISNSTEITRNRRRIKHTFCRSIIWPAANVKNSHKHVSPACQFSWFVACDDICLPICFGEICFETAPQVCDMYVALRPIAQTLRGRNSSVEHPTHASHIYLCYAHIIADTSLHCIRFVYIREYGPPNSAPTSGMNLFEGRYIVNCWRDGAIVFGHRFGDWNVNILESM